ncbi:MAG TPA: sce7726 family protein [Chloroflexota bacterium]|nr:sce7726 family protein [Chloroflexota bacterium]
MSSPSESIVRSALRERVLVETDGAKRTVDEFWVPRSHERADLAVIGMRLEAFEIKTARDTLRRLPRQASAYERLFDRCTVVIAENHRDSVIGMLPEWWGITTIHMNGSVDFTPVRETSANCRVDPEILVRLLWRDEAMAALHDLGLAPDKKASRAYLWRELLNTATLAQLKTIVRRAIVQRDPRR